MGRCRAKKVGNRCSRHVSTLNYILQTPTFNCLYNRDSHLVTGEQPQRWRSEFEQKVTKVKKILSADDSLDRMKEEMEKQISDQPFFTNIEASLESISSSPEYKSYEEIFKDLGGSELEESQDQDKLENLVEYLVKTSACKSKIVLTV
uniref:(California timema) hypothetical protein n=1 Tax=Timema californicum TaxID=61474 RepID=A0A7R9JLT5_TIMCA|nr:unnamed protein product [Timema californicum]